MSVLHSNLWRSVEYAPCGDPVEAIKPAPGARRAEWYRIRRLVACRDHAHGRTPPSMAQIIYQGARYKTA
jgi:hypothetical protein